MQHSWEREYINPTFISKDGKPQEDFLKFLKWVKKNKVRELESSHILDAGCGTGRNAYYLADKYDANVEAFDFAKSAISFAKEHFSHPLVSFSVHDMKDKLPYSDESFDFIFDIMASFSLSDAGRETYLQELHRVLKPGGLMYVRTLAKEGDKNAQFLIKNHPGKDFDTYIHPTLSSQEKVFSGPSFKEVYEKYFEVIFMERKSGYQKFDGQPYKRNYWNVYLRKNV